MWDMSSHRHTISKLALPALRQMGQGYAEHLVIQPTASASHAAASNNALHVSQECTLLCYCAG
jgi:hypothetical protein